MPEVQALTSLRSNFYDKNVIIKQICHFYDPANLDQVSFLKAFLQNRPEFVLNDL